MRLRGVMRAGDRARAIGATLILPTPPSPCIITPRLTARVKYAPVGGGLLHAGLASCRRGVLYAICRARQIEELEVDVEMRRP
jgi:hypothetical protein